MRLLSTLLFAAVSLYAVPGLTADDPARGKELYASCVACHGDSAQGNPTVKAPRLNQLAPVYIVAQLQNFQAGIRGGEGDSDSARQMAAIAATLADEQAMYDTAAYIATLDSAPPAATVEGDVAQGRG